MLIRLALGIKNKDLQRQLERSFPLSDVQIKCFGQMRTAWQKLVRSCGDIIVVSKSLIPGPIDSSIAMLNNLPENPTTVILHDNDSSEEHAQLVAAGADVVLYEKVSNKRLIEAIESTLESRRQLNVIDRFDRRGRVKPKISDFVSDSEEMQIFMEEVQQVISSDSLLLIQGETGTGKEHLAKAIHAESPRSAGPFITVNTAALPEQLLESELFGHEQGAFTGAIRSRRGAFELAHGGTIFLDEIGEMPLHLQTKLLRVLQDFEVTPIGGESSIWVDVRVMAATNRDLEKEVVKGNFRQDLFYRLGVVMLTIPPLRNRKEDIPAMARHFINLYRTKIGRDVSLISEPAMEALCRYSWPGNVRELMNVLERAVLLCRTDEISLRDFPGTFHEGLSLPRELLQMDNNISLSWKNKTLPQVQNEVQEYVEKLYLQMTLKETRGRVGEAARIAGIHPRGLYNKMKKLGLLKKDFKG
ncbi:MAG TPA: sigma-54-dependent Fis family transcriptional regulator [Desulfobacteraceae bacterium]|nr:sigma-54-dependent Fis family transcriptional regulator [Desulfobacteraceae bacterium]